MKYVIAHNTENPKAFVQSRDPHVGLRPNLKSAVRFDSRAEAEAFRQYRIEAWKAAGRYSAPTVVVLPRCPECGRGVHT